MSGDELPAVTVPCLRSKTGRSDAYASSRESLRTRLSSAIGRSNDGGGTTCITSSSKTPRSHALAARTWLRCARRSCSSRAIAASFAIRSACSPIVSPVDGSLSAGGTGTKSRGESFPNARIFSPSERAFCASISAPASLRETVIGTSLAESAPPAIATSCCPASIASAALVAAWNEVAHARMTVNASTDRGSPAPSTISRATFGAVGVGTACP